MALLPEVGISGHPRTVLENQHLVQEFINEMGPTSSANTCMPRGEGWRHTAKPLLEGRHHSHRVPCLSPAQVVGVWSPAEAGIAAE